MSKIQMRICNHRFFCHKWSYSGWNRQDILRNQGERFDNLWVLHSILKRNRIHFRICCKCLYFPPEMGTGKFNKHLELNIANTCLFSKYARRFLRLHLICIHSDMIYKWYLNLIHDILYTKLDTADIGLLLLKSNMQVDIGCIGSTDLIHWWWNWLDITDIKDRLCSSYSL